MADDIVTRLRSAHPTSPQYLAGSDLLADAADEIERLRLLIREWRDNDLAWSSAHEQHGSRHSLVLSASRALGETENALRAEADRG